MKLLIVDDEAKIRRGLERHLSGMDLSFELIETAVNGRQALEKARALRPDIILADICMPGMSGIEFSEIIAAELEHTKIIIISGYDDFAYAQKAIRFGAYEYVLKPLDLPKFDALIRRACREVEQEREQLNRASLAMDAVETNRDALVKNLLLQMLKEHTDPKKIARSAGLVGLELPHSAGLMVIKIVDRRPDRHPEWEFELLHYAIQNIADELCGGLAQRVSFNDAKNNLVFLFAYDPTADYVALQEQISQNTERCTGYSVQIALTHLEDPARRMAQAYRQLMEQLSSTNAFSRIVLDAKKYIEQNYHREDLTLQVVAQEIGANPSYLSRLMHKQLGMSFVDFLTDFRMKKAAILLGSTERDIKLYEISQELGYSSQHYFSRVFTKYYGVSPIHFRTRGGGGGE